MVTFTFDNIAKKKPVGKITQFFAYTRLADGQNTDTKPITVHYKMQQKL